MWNSGIVPASVWAVTALLLLMYCCFIDAAADGYFNKATTGVPVAAADASSCCGVCAHHVEGAAGGGDCTASATLQKQGRGPEVIAEIFATAATAKAALVVGLTLVAHETGCFNGSNRYCDEKNNIPTI